MHGIVLFAHGARDPGWARPFEAIRDRKPGAAREAMRAHLTGSLERYQGLAAEQRKAG